MKVRLVLALTLLQCLGVANSAEFASPEAARKALDSTMALVVKDDISGAFKTLRSYWPLPANELDALMQATIQQRNLASPRFGKSLGYVFMQEERVSDFLLRYTYVERREMHVLRWIFVLYKPNKTWVINSVVWDDKLPELFGP
jgi:hypothetical protein